MFRHGLMDVANEHVRCYLLASAPFHMPPSVQDEQSAVELDWLLQVDGRRHKAAREAAEEARARG